MWRYRELLPIEELARRFNVEDVGHSAGVFDVEKLAWMNRHYMKTAAPSRLASESLRYFLKRGFIQHRTPEAMDYLTSLLAMIWLWRDAHDADRVAALSTGAFWFVLPSLPMFLLLPALLRGGLGFWPSLTASVVGTLALYALWFWAAPRMGIKL